MNTYKYYTLAATALLFLGGAMSSCNEDLQLTDNNAVIISEGFTLEVSSQQKNGTRVALQPNNLDLVWELGDVLTMVNQQTNDYITLTATTLDPNDPTRATFTSQYGVPAGDYWVLYNIDKDTRKLNNIPLTSRDDINNGDCIKMYDIITITSGQTTANVNMKHVYAKVSLNLENVPSDAHSGTEWYVGMIAPKTGFYKQGTLGTSGLSFAQTIQPSMWSPIYPNKGERLSLSGYQSDTYDYLSGFYETYYDPSSGYIQRNVSDFSAFVLPTDLTGDDIYFYIGFWNYSTHVVYELKKQGLGIDAGKNYTINFDFAAANRIELYDNNEVSSVEQLRAIKYLMRQNASVVSDFDCKTSVTGDPHVFPLDVTSLNGNNHIISNMVIDWGFDGAGLVGFSNWSGLYTISKLTLQSASISGKNYVGAFMANYDYNSNRYFRIENCLLTGTSTNPSIVSGEDNVGGIVAYNNIYRDYSNADVYSVVSGCMTDTHCQIRGVNNVGGIIGNLSGYSGSSLAMVSTSGNNADVVATGDNVGGVVGYVVGSLVGGRNRLELCYNTGNVSGKNKVGGIAGYLSDGMAMEYNMGSSEYAAIYQCFNEGAITASEKYAGGIAGEAGVPINQSRNSADVTADSYAGGVTGRGTYIFNCYSMTGSINGAHSGGITGGAIRIDGYDSNTMTNMRKNNVVINCYSSSAVPSGNGIIGSTDDYAEIRDCVTICSTSSSYLNNTSFSDNTEKSVADISVYYGTVNNVSLNSVDGAFSNSAWPNDPYKSLKLTWEVGFDAGSTLPGYGNVLW